MTTSERLVSKVNCDHCLSQLYTHGGAEGGGGGGGAQYLSLREGFCVDGEAITLQRI